MQFPFQFILTSSLMILLLAIPDFVNAQIPNSPPCSCNCKPEGRGLHLAADLDYRWPNQSLIRVRFLDGSAQLQTRVMKVASKWQYVTNLRFEFVQDGDSDIRVDFNQKDGHWSKLGTYAKQFPQDERTMNLQINDMTSDVDLQRVTLHEFGHAIGLVHEQFHPVANIQWNEEAVYKYYTEDLPEKHRWSRDQVFHNILDPGNRGTGITDYDPKSIMHYPVLNFMTKNGYSVGWNTSISESDARGAAALYPSPGKLSPKNALQRAFAHTRMAKLLSTNGKTPVIGELVQQAGENERSAIIASIKADLKSIGLDNQMAVRERQFCHACLKRAATAANRQTPQGIVRKNVAWLQANGYDDLSRAQIRREMKMFIDKIDAAF